MTKLKQIPEVAPPSAIKANNQTLRFNDHRTQSPFLQLYSKEYASKEVDLTSIGTEPIQLVKVNSRTEFRQTTSNYFGLRGSDEQLDKVDGLLDEYHKIEQEAPSSEADRNEKQSHFDERFKVLDEIEQQLLSWYRAKKKEPDNKYRKGVDELRAQIQSVLHEQKQVAKNEQLDIGLTTREKDVKRKIKSLSKEPKMPAWKRKARAKSQKAKKRKEEAIEKDERYKKIVGGVLAGLMISGTVIDTVNHIQQSQNQRRRGTSKLSQQSNKKVDNSDNSLVPKLSSSNSTDSQNVTQNVSQSLAIISNTQVSSQQNSTSLQSGLSMYTGHGEKVNISGKQDIRPHPMSMKNSEKALVSSSAFSKQIQHAKMEIANHHKDNSSLSHGSRFTKDIQQTLLFGSSMARANSDHGQKPLIGTHHLNNTLSTMDSMSDKDHQSFASIYNALGNTELGAKKLDKESLATQRALMLKALGARSSVFAKGSTKEKQQALSDLSEFGSSLNGIPRDALVRMITPYDVDERHSDSNIDPTLFEERESHTLVHQDRDTENDGIFQYYTDSCTPTSMMVAKAEADPAYALKLQNEEFAKSEQLRILTLMKGESSLRESAGHLELLEKQAEDPGEHISGQQNLLKYAKNEVEDLSDEGEAFLKVLQEKHDGLPNMKTLQTIRKGKSQYTTGSKHKEHVGALDKELEDSSLSHVFVEHDPPFGAVATKNAVKFKKSTGSSLSYKAIMEQQLEEYNQGIISQIEKSILSGKIVTANIDNPGHTTAIVDLKYSKSGIKFLIHDPFTGRTMWVPQGELFSGGHVASKFMGKTSKTQGNLKSFVLPKDEL